MSAQTLPSGTIPATYAAPPRPEALAARLGIPLAEVVKLDANESAYGPPPRARAALAALPDLLAGGGGPGRYPDPDASDLRAALAESTGVDAERIVVGNGSDELIGLLSEVTLRRGDEVVIAGPTFSVYALAARRLGAAVVDVGLDADYGVPADALTAAMGPRTRLVYLCAPNNPTGTPLPRATLLAALDRADALAAASDGTGPLVVVDEAYYELGAFAGEPNAWSAAPLVAEGRRVVVLRTFSKLYGLAGLRVGYALCPGTMADAVRARKFPYNANVAGLVAARAALDDRPWLEDVARRLASERRRVSECLAALPGLTVRPSTANFVLAEVAGGASARDALWSGLLDRGILVRAFSSPDRLAAALRVSIGTPEQNDRLLAACAANIPDALRDGDAR